tara:strand:+ start:627 stop:899 length:273 start_codon:yes stop_codon:yes gene_type:complete
MISGGTPHDAWSKGSREEAIGMARAEVVVCQSLDSGKANTGPAVKALVAALRGPHVASGDVSGGRDEGGGDERARGHAPGEVVAIPFGQR